MGVTGGLKECYAFPNGKKQYYEQKEPMGEPTATFDEPRLGVGWRRGLRPHPPHNEFSKPGLEEEVAQVFSSSFRLPSTPRATRSSFPREDEVDEDKDEVPAGPEFWNDYKHGG
ncbi:hypothetical protein PG994_002927 [Apiospora phragmitis]|uniref:Uncharacterized protein n=1 Tax=Apiospora phragmitis TaxID=2905665 RepID=A0ABR1W6L8_9PEZI